MNKKDELINENSIDDLIRYAETDDADDLSEDEPILSAAAASAADDGEAPRTLAEERNEYMSENADFDEDDFTDELPEDDYGAPIPEGRGTRAGIIAGIAIGIAAVIVFISVDSGIIGKYKNNFANNFSAVFSNFKSEKSAEQETPTPKPDIQYKTEVAANVIVPLEGANEAEFVPYKNGVLCAMMNHLSYIDNTGATVWEENTVIVDPILKSKGNYILLAERGRNKICLYNDKKLVFETEDPDAIAAANVSSNGDVIIVTDKSSYKGGISVYNKSGSQIFSWASGSDTVISADISSSSRRVAVALLNTDTRAKSVIQLFDVNKTDSYAQINADDSVIFSVEFADDTLNAFGDNRITGVSSSGKLLYDNTFENVQLTHSAVDAEGSKLVSYDDGNIPMLNLYAPGGALRESTALTGVTDFIGVKGRNALYNIGRDVYFGKLNSKNITKYTANMDIRDLYAISENVFAIVYSNSIELVTL